MRYFHIANLLHAFLASLLLLQQLALTAHVTTVALGGYVLAHLLDGLTGNDLGTDGCLYGNVELLAGDELLPFLRNLCASTRAFAALGCR